ncbi:MULTISPECIES: VanZ family protein [unclassified Herbaspirillum]|uniref:VanZ family protein n=1 Tax=unclassified Herbaspirillum TaxID=2624150 RepID=UPI00114FBDE5|nr:MULTISPECIES: VanZ family protein [unclassified Herbaspirillum]MBB5390220.1 VanZ family protein [Herbaspirillum sp. SJZ102]TQK09282.1 VanZ family protein [Herbaspirillum sp. SJZ130]TQK14031.1 VanZ family protein [Herbaspirillum sp. SJZ106]
MEAKPNTTPAPSGKPPPNTPIAPAASSFARVSLLVYTLLIVYASWYPFSGWRDMGLGPFDYLWSRLPYYWTGFDIWTNIAGYAPLGMLLVLAMHPRIAPAWAIWPATAAGVLLSACMEAVQTYLPTRIPSNLDLLTNAAGVFVGALLGAACSRYFLRESRLLAMRRRWFSGEASRGLAVAGLWPLALVYPQNHLFGLGHLVPPLSAFFSDLLDTPVDLATTWINNAQLSAEQYWLADVIVTACGLTGAALLLLLLLRKQAPRRALVMLYLFGCIAVKSLACALFFAPQNAFVWVSASSAGGIVIGAMMVTGLSFAPPTAQRRLAALALIISLALTNAVPANPYYISTLETWVQGKFLNFDGAAQFLSVLWPFLAIWFLYHPVHRKQK